MEGCPRNREQVLNKSGPITADDATALFTGCSSISVVADGYLPYGPTAHGRFVLNTYSNKNIWLDSVRRVTNGNNKQKQIVGNECMAFRESGTMSYG